MKIILAFCFLSTLFLLVSCETEEQAALVKAQKCLNESSPSTAANCKNFLNGHRSPEAYALRCSADFLAEGVSAEAMASALRKRDSTTTTNNPLLGMMGVITFRTEALAAVAQNDCAESGYASYLMLAEMSVVSTRMASLTGLTASINPSTGVKPTQEEFEAALTGNAALTNPSDETKELIGNSVQSISETYCTAENTTSKVCTTITNAIASAANDTALAIGGALLTALLTK